MWLSTVTSIMENKVNVLVAGSGNVTGMNVIRALVGEPNVTIYGCDFDAVNPSNQWCQSFVSTQFRAIK